MSPPSGIERRGPSSRAEPPMLAASTAATGRGVSAVSDLQGRASFPQLALSLLSLAATETVEAERETSQALVHQMFSNSSGSDAWSAYQRRLTEALTNPALALREVHRLAAMAPGDARGLFPELVSILQERDPDCFAESLLALAGRNLRAGRALGFTRELLQVAAGFPVVEARARALLEVLAGQGNFGAQFEFQAPRLTRELSSPLMLASFGTAIFASRAASMAVLARASNLGWRTLLLSEGAALSAEVPALVLSRRLGARVFVGGDQLFSPREIERELLVTFGPFALLRVSGVAFQFAGPTLRRLGEFTAGAGELDGFGRFALGSLRFGSDLSAILAGNSLNTALGLMPAVPSGSDALFQGLLTLGHMRLAGRLMEGFGFNPLQNSIERQQQHLSQNRAQDLLSLARLGPEHYLHTRATQELSRGLQRGNLHSLTIERWIAWGRDGEHGRVATAMERTDMPLLADYFARLAEAAPLDHDSNDDLLFAREFAFPRTFSYQPRRGFKLIDGVYMAMQGDGSAGGGGGEGGERGGGSGVGEPKVEATPSRKSVVMELLRQGIDDYAHRAKTQDTVLGKAVKGLQGLLDRINDRPDLENDESFAKALAEIETELASAKQHESPLRRTVDTLKVLFRSSATSEEAIMQPEVAEQKGAELERDENQRSAFASSLARMQEVLQKARDFGWSEELYGQLERAKNGLNRFYSKAVWRIPDFERLLRRKGNAGEILPRRQGAALGLALTPEPGVPDSPLAQQLRGVEPPQFSVEALELEWLHEAILLAAQKPELGEWLGAQVQKLAEAYRANPEATAAMHLTAEAVRVLVQGGSKALNLLEYLQGNAHAGALQDRFVLLEALKDPDGDLRLSLEQLGYESSAPDYFSSGLHLFLQAQGDAARLTSLLQTARRVQAVGYHPSIAVSLFGAAYGRKQLPASLLPKEPQLEAFLRRAFPEEKK